MGYNDEAMAIENGLRQKLASSKGEIRTLAEWLQFVVDNIELPESTEMQMKAEIRKAQEMSEEECCVD